MKMIKVSDETHTHIKKLSEETHISMSKLVALQFDKKKVSK